MTTFDHYIVGRLRHIGYGLEAIGEKPAGITMEFKGLGATGFANTFAVVYLRQASSEAAADHIRAVFEYHKKPVLFVVDESLVEVIKAAIPTEKIAPPLWFRALHAIYYGRVYVWRGRDEIQALHVDWDKREATYGETIEISKIVLTETDSLLRDYPGRFQIARFNDRAFWKGDRKAPPKRNSKQRTQAEGYWQEEFRRNESTANQKPPPNAGDAFREAFKRIFEEEMRRQQAQRQYTHYQRPYRYDQPAGDQWFRMMMEGGTKEEAKRVYRQLGLQYHPDHNKNADATATMQAINNAYEKVMRVLS